MKILNSLMFSFLWSSYNNGGKFHLTNWSSLAFLYRNGCWNIKNVFWFNTALSLKSLWPGLFGDNLWSKVFHAKYIKMDIFSWFRAPRVTGRNSSYIWRGFMKILLWICSYLSWDVGCGKNVFVGVDPIAGVSGNFCLSQELRNLFSSYGLFTLNQFKRTSYQVLDSSY